MPTGYGRELDYRSAWTKVDLPLPGGGTKSIARRYIRWDGDDGWVEISPRLRKNVDRTWDNKFTAGTKKALKYLDPNRRGGPNTLKAMEVLGREAPIYIDHPEKLGLSAHPWMRGLGASIEKNRAAQNDLAKVKFELDLKAYDIGVKAVAEENERRQRAAAPHLITLGKEGVDDFKRTEAINELRRIDEDPYPSVPDSPNTGQPFKPPAKVLPLYIDQGASIATPEEQQFAEAGRKTTTIDAAGNFVTSITPQVGGFPEHPKEHGIAQAGGLRYGPEGQIISTEKEIQDFNDARQAYWDQVAHVGSEDPTQLKLLANLASPDASAQEIFDTAMVVGEGNPRRMKAYLDKSPGGNILGERQIQNILAQKKYHPERWALDDPWRREGDPVTSGIAPSWFQESRAQAIERQKEETALQGLLGNLTPWNQSLRKGHHWPQSQQPVAPAYQGGAFGDIRNMGLYPPQYGG